MTWNNVYYDHCLWLSYMQFPCHINLLSRSLTIDCFVKALWKSSLELWNHWRKTPFPSSCRQRHTHLTHALLFHIFLSIVNYKVFEITCSKVPKCLVFSFLSFFIFPSCCLKFVSRKRNSLWVFLCFSNFRQNFNFILLI